MTNVSKNDVNEAFEEKVEDVSEEVAEEAAEETKETVEEATEEQPKENKEQEESFESKYLRLMADFQNYKRRSEKERADIHAYANEKIAGEILNVMDNFERALALDADGDGKFHEGMEMIFTQLKAVLDGSGVEEIKAISENFDPNFHNAVMMEDVEDDQKDKVIEVLQKGYTLKGKVIRPSMVKVGK